MTDDQADEAIERRLRSGLAQRAASVHPDSDFEAVTRRAAKVDGRNRRALVVALVVALVLGPAVGFVVGRGTESDNTQTAADDTGDQGSAGNGEADDREADDDAGTASDESVEDGADGDAPSSLLPGPVGDSVAGYESAVSSASGGGFSVGEAFGYDFQPLERVAVRTTADGVAIRIYRSPYDQQEAFGNFEVPPWAPDWQPTGVCYPSAGLSAGLSSEFAVGEAWHDLWPEPTETTATQGSFGLEQGDHNWWVMLQTTPDVASVRANFASGAVDEMAPIEGIAVLAGSAGDVASAAPDGDPWTPQGTVDLLDGAGAVIGTLELGQALWNQADPWSSEDYRERCEPPPPPPIELPAAGEQPADVAAASAAVTTAFEIAYDGSVSAEEKAPYIDDPDGALADAQAQATESFGDIVGQAGVEVTELVFTAPDTAVVRYDIVIPDYSTFPERFGEARLIDGTWKVTAGTVCASLELAGATCEGVDSYPQPDPYAPYYDLMEEQAIAADQALAQEEGTVSTTVIVDE